MSETLTDLRTELFATLRGLRDKDEPLDLARAHAVAELAQTIINTAKVEVEYVKATGGHGGSKFVELAPADPAKRLAEKGHPTATGTVTNTGGGLVHRMR